MAGLAPSCSTTKIISLFRCLGNILKKGHGASELGLTVLKKKWFSDKNEMKSLSYSCHKSLGLRLINLLLCELEKRICSFLSYKCTSPFWLCTSSLFPLGWHWFHSSVMWRGGLVPFVGSHCDGILFFLLIHDVVLAGTNVSGTTAATTASRTREPCNDGVQVNWV